MAFAQSELSFFLNARHRHTDSRAVADLAHHVLFRTLMQSVIWHWVRRVQQGHTKLPSDRRETGILQRSVGCLIHKDIQRKCLKKRLKHGRNFDRASLIKQINQRRNRLNARVQAKGKHFEHLLWRVCP